MRRENEFGQEEGGGGGGGGGGGRSRCEVGWDKSGGPLLLMRFVIRYVCVRVCACVGRRQINRYTHTHIHAHTNIHHAHTHAYAHTRTHTHTHMHEHAHKGSIKAPVHVHCTYLNESCHTYACGMAHVWISHITHANTGSRINEALVAAHMKESYHISYDMTHSHVSHTCTMTHVNTGSRIQQADMAAHMNESLSHMKESFYI